MVKRIRCDKIRIRACRKLRRNPLIKLIRENHKAKRHNRLVQPITVLRVPKLKRFILIDGFARLKAYRSLKLRTIWAHIVDLPVDKSPDQYIAEIQFHLNTRHEG